MRKELSYKEKQYVYWASQGLTNKQIASKFYVDTRSVEGVLSGAYKKIGIRKRTKLVAICRNWEEPKKEPIPVKLQILQCINNGICDINEIIEIVDSSCAESTIKIYASEILRRKNKKRKYEPFDKLIKN